MFFRESCAYLEITKIYHNFMDNRDLPQIALPYLQLQKRTRRNSTISEEFGEILLFGEEGELWIPVSGFLDGKRVQKLYSETLVKSTELRAQQPLAMSAEVEGDRAGDERVEERAEIELTRCKDLVMVSGTRKGM